MVRYTTSERRRFSALMASFLVLPVSSLRWMNARASGLQRIWVIAIRWMAALTCRFPPRLRRNRSRFDDHTGIGAVPFQAANASRLVNRVMSAVSPISLAAVNPAQPDRSSSDGLSCSTSVAMSDSSWLAGDRLDPGDFSDPEFGDHPVESFEERPH